jgi:hypothetical protein
MTNLTPIEDRPFYFTRFRDTEPRKARVRNGYPLKKHGYPYPFLTFETIPGIELGYLEDPDKWTEQYLKEPYPVKLVEEIRRRGVLI